MRTTTLGSLSSSAIGYGCMGLSQGYGPADDATSTRLLRRAVDLGVTMFDTARSYGSGHNERLVGAALAPVRDRVILATKVGIERTANGVELNGRPAFIWQAGTESLERLGTDVIDLYYLHRPDPQVPIEESIGAMAELVAAGKVRQVGVSEVTPDQLRRAHRTHPIAALQLEWSMAWREPEREIVPLASELGIGLVPYSPLGRGLLSATLDDASARAADFRRSDPRFSGSAFAQNATLAGHLAQYAASIGATASQVALAWLMTHPHAVPIPGTRDSVRLEENCAAAELDLDVTALLMAVPDEWAGDRASFAVPVTARS